MYYITGEGYVNGTANSAHSILLRHSLTESGVGYVCNVTDVERGEKREVNKIALSRLATVTGLLPDTTYRVECVAYHSGGVEACLEVNTTVTTCELHIQWTHLNNTFQFYFPLSLKVSGHTIIQNSVR